MFVASGTILDGIESIYAVLQFKFKKPFHLYSKLFGTYYKFQMIFVFFHFFRNFIAHPMKHLGLVSYRQLWVRSLQKL